MSVVDNKTIDGVALTNDKNGIILLIADHLDWSDEYQHLMMLQRKINVYITFLEEKQYEEIYKGEDSRQEFYNRLVHMLSVVESRDLHED